MAFKKISILATLILLAACAPSLLLDGHEPTPDNSFPAFPEPSFTPTPTDQHSEGGAFIKFGFDKPKPGHCSSGLQWYESKNQLQYEKQINFPVHRAKQRVIRYDCNSQISSDKIETVSAPRVDITLKPSSLHFSAQAVSLFNYETCERTSADLGLIGSAFNKLLPINKVSGYSSGKITIKGDDSPAVFTFQLKRGLNQIYYTYYSDCTSTEISRTSNYGVEACERAGKTNYGVYNVYADYTEELRPGTLELKQSIEECNKK